MVKLWNKLLAPTGGSQSLLKKDGPTSDLFNDRDDDDSSSLSGREPKKKKSANSSRRLFLGKRLLRRTNTTGVEDGYGKCSRCSAVGTCRIFI